jgi:carboxymethylenebutenolidase
MLITKEYHDVPHSLNPNGQPIRIFVISPNVPGYPQAKFPGTPYMYSYTEDSLV